MSTTVKFLILYSIPILTVIGTYLTYGLGYGTNAEGLVKLSFFIAIVGLISSFNITVKLVSKFLKNKISYAGIIFAILGSILDLISIGIFILFFQMELGFY